MSMGRNIAGERVRQGLHQKDLALRAGLTQAALSRIELGQAVPRIDTLSRIAVALNVRLDLLVPEVCAAIERSTAAA